MLPFWSSPKEIETQKWAKSTSEEVGTKNGPKSSSEEVGICSIIPF